MKIISSLLIFLLVLTVNLSAQNTLQLVTDSRNNIKPGDDFLNFEDKDFLDFNSKYGKALLLSTFVPGSGQVYLGNNWRGAAITLAFWGSAVTAILSHNNFTGREDRLKILTVDYKASGTYKLADKIWQEIEYEKGNRDYNYKRRNTFNIITALIYAYNIADLLFLTVDSSENGELVSIELMKEYDTAHAGQNKLIELKYFLP